jgi:hypothetical protein
VRSGSLDWDRWSRLSGVAFVVVAVAAFLALGEVPKIDDSTDELVSFYDGDRGRVLTGTILFGFALIVLGWFIGTIAHILLGAGQGRLGAIGLVLGAGFLGAQAVVTAIVGGLSLNIAAAGDAGVIQALHSTQWSVDNLSGFFLAGTIAAASIGLVRGGVLDDWFGWAGAVAVVVALQHGTNWSEDGFWAPGGGWTIITIIVALLWTLVTSVMLYRAPGTMPVTELSPGPAMGGTAAS